MIFELRSGIRLPDPDHCPTSIALLIQSCFKEEPNDRPSFSQLKTTIYESHNNLKRQNEEAMSNAIGGELEVRYADIQMEERYIKMKKENNNFQLCTKIRIDTPDLSIKSTDRSIDVRPGIESLTDGVGSYLSLQNMTSGGVDKTSNSHEHGCLPSSDQDVIRRGLLNPLKSNLTRCMSPGLPRNSSFSAGEDLSPLLPEQKHFTGMTPSKSYPNPDYILNLADHENFIPPENITKTSL